MFVLEVSQLLEDTIDDANVVALYNKLSSYEQDGDILKLSSIINDSLSIKFVNLLLQYASKSNLDIHGTCDTTKMGLDYEDKISFTNSLGLNQDDTIALALTLSSALLELFILDNYIGPIVDKNIPEGQMAEIYQQLSRDLSHKALTVGCSEIPHKIVNPYLMKVSYLCWLYINVASSSRKLLHLELLVRKHRLLKLHLNLLLEPAETIMNELKKIEEFIFDHHILKADQSSQLLRFNRVALCCELIQGALMRGSITFCRKFLNYASEYCQVEIHQDGVLGRKTRYQTKDIPQLITRVDETKSKNITLPKETDKLGLPLDVNLEDDTLLNDISFANLGIGSENTQLSIESQLLLLSDMEIMDRSNVTEQSLKDECVLAYVRTLIKQSTIWTLTHKSLSYRSKTEKIYRRRVDRALRQLEELIKESSQQTTELNRFNKRNAWFHSVLPLSTWQMQRLLGDVSLELGLLKNALDIYEKIEYWDGIIKCHCGLGRTEKAREIVLQELEKCETPRLYCILGDVTDDLTHYEKAWTISNCRCARAKKSIGTYYYVRKDLKTAKQHYELAHKSSPSDTSILSMLAYCCLNLELYDEAACHYRNLSYLDESNFLAWNNLTKSYVSLGQKERAWRTMKEAIKCNHEEWKLWDNFLMLSLDIGQLDEVINAWNRLLDLKSSYKDDGRLNKLTYGILERSFEENETAQVTLIKKGLSLIARIISSSESTPRVWLCNFKLLARQYEMSRDSQSIDQSDFLTFVSKITNSIQRATPKPLLLEIDWIHKIQDTQRIIACFDELLDCYEYLFDTLGAIDELKNRWKSFKLSVVNTLKSIRSKIEELNLSA